MDGGGKSKREDGKTKKTACGKAGAHRPNHINTDWRKDGGRTDGWTDGGRERSAVRQTHIGNQVSFCELKGQRGHSVHVCVSVYLTG